MFNPRKPIQKSQELVRYEKNYSDKNFWRKIKRLSKRLNAKVVYAALMLYYGFKSPEISAKDKAVIIGALGYLILPLDFIPDFLISGLMDDWGALLFALHTVYKSITPDIKQQAEAKLTELLGKVDINELKIF